MNQQQEALERLRQFAKKYSIEMPLTPRYSRAIAEHADNVWCWGPNNSDGATTVRLTKPRQLEDRIEYQVDFPLLGLREMRDRRKVVIEIHDGFLVVEYQTRTAIWFCPRRIFFSTELALKYVAKNHLIIKHWELCV